MARGGTLQRSMRAAASEEGWMPSLLIRWGFPILFQLCMQPTKHWTGFQTPDQVSEIHQNKPEPQRLRPATHKTPQGFITPRVSFYSIKAPKSQTIIKWLYLKSYIYLCFIEHSHRRSDSTGGERLVQGHSNKQTGEASDWSTDFPIGRQPALAPEL